MPNDDGVAVPISALVHLEVADDVAACERAGVDWSGTGDFYLTAADSPRAKFINCRDCIVAMTEGHHFPEPCAVAGQGHVWCATCMEAWPCPEAPSARPKPAPTAEVAAVRASMKTEERSNG